MKPSRSAKARASISFLALAAIALMGAGGQPQTPTFECGSYLVAGHFGQNSRGEFTLTMRHDSPSPFELLVFGGDLQAKMDKVDLDVVAEVDVPRTIRGPSGAIVMLKAFSEQRLRRGEEKRFLTLKECSR